MLFYTTRSCLQFVLFFYQAGDRSDFRQFWCDPVRTNSGWWFGVLVDLKFSTNLNSDAALGYGDAKRNPAWFQLEFSLSVEFGIQPEHLFKNSAKPAKLASASSFAGRWRGDSTLIQTQFLFRIHSLTFCQTNPPGCCKPSCILPGSRTKAKSAHTWLFIRLVNFVS